MLGNRNQLASLPVRRLYHHIKQHLLSVCVLYFDATATECSPETRPLLMRNDAGVIASPNYPNNYYNNAECQWVVVAPDDKVRITNSQLILSDSCLRQTCVTNDCIRVHIQTSISISAYQSMKKDKFDTSACLKLWKFML